MVEIIHLIPTSNENIWKTDDHTLVSRKFKLVLLLWAVANQSAHITKLLCSDVTWWDLVIVYSQRADIPPLLVPYILSETGKPIQCYWAWHYFYARIHTSRWRQGRVCQRGNYFQFVSNCQGKTVSGCSITGSSWHQGNKSHNQALIVM